MGFVPQVTCHRCKTKYSSLRGRCPKCGTRRVQNSQRVPGTTPSAVQGTAANKRVNENRKWQLIFGVIMIVAVLAALIVMITVSLGNADHPGEPALPSIPPEMSAAPTPTPVATPTPTPMPEVTSIAITYGGETLTEFMLRMSQTIQLSGSHFPMTIPADYKWSSADESIATVDQSGNVTPVGAGTTTLTLEMYGKTATCTVYVRG